jgi:hypothetical protein
MKFLTGSTVLFTLLSFSSVLAAPAPAPEPVPGELVERGCSAGYICLSGSCRTYSCAVSGWCSIGPPSSTKC